jgi:hypothetical protein
VGDISHMASGGIEKSMLQAKIGHMKHSNWFGHSTSCVGVNGFLAKTPQKAPKRPSAGRQ